MNSDFYLWVLDNECYLKRQEKAQPFIFNCIHDYNLFNLVTEKDIFNYLWVNGYPEFIIQSFLLVWKAFEHCTIKE